MVTLMCQGVDSDFYPVDRMFSITISTTSLISDIKSLIISQNEVIGPVATYKLTLWKLSDPSLIGDDGGGLGASNLLRIFRRSGAGAGALGGAFPVSRYFGGASSVPGLHILVQTPVPGPDGANPLSPPQPSSAY